MEFKRKYHRILIWMFLASVVILSDACSEGQHSSRKLRRRSDFRVAESSRIMPTTSNFYTLSAVQRRHQWVNNPGSKQTRLKSPAHRVKDSAFAGNAIPQESDPQKIVIPIGVSHYKPIQYVNSFKDTDLSFKLPKTPNRTVERGNDTEIKVAVNSAKRTSQSENAKEEVTSENSTSTINANTPRLIELESSYIPLTIRFTSRASKLNVVPGEGQDLIGQDSNQVSNSKVAPTNTIPDVPRTRNLDSRVIFGSQQNEEPLVLKQGNSQIPPNMQRIIKCIFPDFKFDGADKVESAC